MNRIVIDHGSALLKAGLLSEETPSIQIDSIVSKQRGDAQFKVTEGELRPNSILCRPVENGHVVHSEQASTQYAYIFEKLKCQAEDTELLFS